MSDAEPPNADSPSEPRPGLGAVFLAPWRYLRDPRRAADVMIRARWSHWLEVVAAHALLFFLFLFVCLAIAETPAGEPILSADFPNRVGLVSGTFLDNMAREAGPHFDNGYFLLLAGVVQFALGWLALALLFWPAAIDGANPKSAYWRTVRSLAGGVGLVILLAAIIGVSSAQLHRIENDFQTRDLGFIFEGVPIVVCFLATIGVLAVCSSAATAAARPAARPEEPLCESCGYNLTYASADGVCSECGAATSETLDLSQSRRRAPDGSFISAFAHVWFRPEGFYRELAVYSDPIVARRFERRVYAGVFGATAAWFALNLLSVHFGPKPQEVMLIAPIIGSAAVLAGFAIQRCVAAIVALVWAWKRVVREPAALRLLVPYESAYLFFFYFWNAVMIASFIHAEEWITRLIFGSGTIFPIAEMIVLPGGNVALVGAWLLRYRKIARAVRWANY